MGQSLLAKVALALQRCSGTMESEMAIFHGLASSCVPGMDAKLFIFMLVKNCAAASFLACLGLSWAFGPSCGFGF